MKQPGFNLKGIKGWLKDLGSEASGANASSFVDA
jgi:hypothetical protein